MSRFCQELLTFLFGVLTLITLTSLACSTSLYAITGLFALFEAHCFRFTMDI